MYERFYGFHTKPFSVLPDAHFLYRSRGHRLALSLLEYGLKGQTGFTIITGEIGCGKTTVLQYALRHSDPTHTIACITNTAELNHDLLKWVVDAFGIQSSAKDNVELYRIFSEFVRVRHSQGRDCVLVIDEAQLLNPETLESVRLLSNVNLQHEHLLKIILVGQPELLETLSRPDLIQFSQRISTSYHLEPLGLLETREYIRNRLRIAGGDETLFDEAACDAIFVISKGVPRQINILCDTSLVYGYADERPAIDCDVVWTVLRDRATAKNIDSMRVSSELTRAGLEEMIRAARRSEANKTPVASNDSAASERDVPRSPESDRSSLPPAVSVFSTGHSTESVQNVLPAVQRPPAPVNPQAESLGTSLDPVPRLRFVTPARMRAESGRKTVEHSDEIRLTREMQTNLLDLVELDARANLAKAVPSSQAGTNPVLAKPFTIIPQAPEGDGLSVGMTHPESTGVPQIGAKNGRRILKPAVYVLVLILVIGGVWALSGHGFAWLSKILDSVL